MSARTGVQFSAAGSWSARNCRASFVVRRTTERIEIDRFSLSHFASIEEERAPQLLEYDSSSWNPVIAVRFRPFGSRYANGSSGDSTSR